MSEVDNLPGSPGHPGTYEVWFLTLTDRDSGRGYWIRSTLGTTARSVPLGGVWFARFDRGDPSRNLGIHRQFPVARVAGDAFDVQIGDCSMRSGRAAGSLEGGGHTLRWELEYPTGRPTYPLLPEPFYRGGLAPTKPFAPNPATRFSGTVAVDGETHDVREAPGQQGHLWGSRHAERWAWAQCGDFVDDDTVVHALTAKGRRGPFTTPYLTSVGVHRDGRWIRLFKLSAKPAFGLGTWKLDVQSRSHRLTGRIEAPATDLIRARYEDPDGRARYCHNSEVASSRLALFERRAGGFEEVALLESRGNTHAEWAGLTPASVVEREFVEVAT